MMENNSNQFEISGEVSPVTKNQKNTEIQVLNSEKIIEKPISEEDKITSIIIDDLENGVQCEAVLEKLFKDLKRITKNANSIEIQKQARLIRQNYDEVYRKLISLKKQKFISEGGESIDFKYEHSSKNDFYDVFKNHRTRLKHDLKEREKQQLTNYEAKQQIIEDLKTLIDHDKHEGNIYQRFRLLQERWRSIGDVPREHYQEIWKVYHFHVERFYDLLHINNDLRDIDLNHNLSEKLALIKRAEFLFASNDIHYAFKELQMLHKRWKEDTGPVAKDQREEVWEKFNDVTRRIHDKRHEYFQQKSLIEKENATKKLGVINSIELLDTSKNKTNKDWQQSIKEFEELRSLFFAIGHVPTKEYQQIWSMFKKASSDFNSKKNKFYADLKGTFAENLKKKQELLNLAEENKNSDEWESTTQLMIEIQAKWKTIGNVPRSHSDKLWAAFRGACNHYFDRLQNQHKNEIKQQEKASEEKKQFLDDLMSSNSDDFLNEESIKELILKWLLFPTNHKIKDKLDLKFHNYILNLAKKHNLDQLKIDLYYFTNSTKKHKENQLFHLISSEKSFLKKRVAELSKKVSQLENNLGFFSNFLSENPDFRKINHEIEEAKTQLDSSKRKLNYLEKIEIPSSMKS